MLVHNKKTGAFLVVALLLVLSLPFRSRAAGKIEIGFGMSGEMVSLKDAIIVTDSKDSKLVHKVAGMFSHDFMMVTGDSLQTGTKSRGKSRIVFGTTGSRHIRELEKKGIIDTNPIKGGTEQFIVKSVRNPFGGCTDLLVVAGSDPRGAAYGLLTLSEKMGVSPWYWWADVPVARHEGVYIQADFVSKAPSVRYRGIFINDEDWGLYQWSSKTYEPEIGNIGPGTYRRVCELLLRLKCNMLAPAMHTCSDPFYKHPENKLVADEFGIMITTSHCEPLLFNNASGFEWRSDRDGEWDYGTNRQTIYNKLDARVREAAGFENIYTMGLRGLHDEGMRGNHSMAERVRLLEQAIADQRGILSGHIHKPVDSIPQILVPYKEVQQIYENGLSVPEDITLVWPDDNYGYMKMLSNPDEQKRPGRSGIYYHISYLGVPHDYLWLSTTPPVLMYEELKKAYETGADRYWLLNVGDIKPMELSIQTFFEMAWDFSRFDYRNANTCQAGFLASLTDEKFRPELQFILDEYYRLAWSRKPEHMGWEREWDSPEFTGLRSTEFSFSNYNDAHKRLSDYARISRMTSEIMSQLPDDRRPMFFEMLGYPVLASEQMNVKFLMAQLNQELMASGDRAKANWAGKEARKAFDALEDLTARYNSLLDGKWKHMMEIPRGICALYHEMPKVDIGPETPEEVDLTPVAAKYQLDSCLYVPVNSFSRVRTDKDRSFRLIKGLGYDWEVIRMGEITDPAADASSVEEFCVDYTLPAIAADSVRVTVYTVPRFPLYKGADTSFGISVDGATPVVFNYIPVEQSRQWKDNVIRNSMISESIFAIDRNSQTHRLSISCGAPGLMVQRILVDWGGLRPSYVGPSAGSYTPGNN